LTSVVCNALIYLPRPTIATKKQEEIYLFDSLTNFSNYKIIRRNPIAKTIMERNILIIENDEKEILMFREALDKIPAPFTLTHVTEPSAEELLERARPHFIFLDLDTTNNGFRLLEKIRNVSWLQHTHLILYAHGFDEESRKKANEYGVDTCLKKPFMVRLLAKRLKEILLRYKPQS
jgi:DNA-binding response OmpR family regulator